jgi:hypothetical protein
MGTQFMTGLVSQEDSFEAGKEVAEQIYAKMKPQRTPDLAIIFCSVKYDYDAVMRGIKSIAGDVPMIGCSSAGQFSDEGTLKDGLVCAMIISDNYHFYPSIGTNLKSEPIQAIKNATKSFSGKTRDLPFESAILLVDGLAGKGEEAVLAASSALGPKVKFAGGAAADNLAFKETSVFGNGQALTDAISLCLVNSRDPVIIAVKHGHKPISGPMRITKAKDNIIYEVEGRPALDVWKDCLRDEVKLKGIDIDKLTLQELSKILLKYEAGLQTGSEYKIRFPASCNSDGSLNFVCTMMEGAVIKIMTSEPQDQIESIQQAIQNALNASHGIDIAGGIVFDCACRAMILEEEFPKAVMAGKEMIGKVPFIGCETYGEIAMEVGQLSGFHNTTTVIMLFPA